MPVQPCSRQRGSRPSHQYSPTRCHSPSSRSSSSGSSILGNTTCWPKARHSRRAIWTAASREKAWYGQRAKGGIWASNTPAGEGGTGSGAGGGGAQATRISASSSASRRITPVVIRAIAGPARSLSAAPAKLTGAVARLIRLSSRIRACCGGRIASQLSPGRPAARNIGGRRSRVLAPQVEAAGQPIGVRDNRSVCRQWKGDVLGVAAADVQVIEPHDLAQDVDRLCDSFVPGLLSLLPAGRVADVFIIGLVSADRVMGELEMRHDLTVAKYRGAGAGPERQHHFDPPALDGAKTLDIGIVENADRLAQMLREHRLQIEIRQAFGAEIGSGQNPPVAHITRKPDRHPLEVAERRYRLIDGADEILGRDRFGRRRHSLPLANHVSGVIEQGGFDPGPADIDRKRAKFVHGSSLPAGFAARHEAEDIVRAALPPSRDLGCDSAAGSAPGSRLFVLLYYAREQI